MVAALSLIRILYLSNAIILGTECSYRDAFNPYSTRGPTPAGAVTKVMTADFTLYVHVSVDGGNQSTQRKLRQIMNW